MNSFAPHGVIRRTEGRPERPCIRGSGPPFRCARGGRSSRKYRPPLSLAIGIQPDIDAVQIEHVESGVVDRRGEIAPDLIEERRLGIRNEEAARRVHMRKGRRGMGGRGRPKDAAREAREVVLRTVVRITAVLNQLIVDLQTLPPYEPRAPSGVPRLLDSHRSWWRNS